MICLTIFVLIHSSSCQAPIQIYKSPDFSTLLGSCSILVRPVPHFSSVRSSFFSFSYFGHRLRNHYWSWNEKGEEVDYKITTRKRKSCDAPRSKPVSKKKSNLKKLERINEKRGAGIARIGYDPKSVEKFGEIVK